ncbi:AraC family transcriptional regulator [Puia sp.]|jgi:AraC-like DNA-binding protein|uniref:AraC family transcriptional regulator n=1 Tax=Puia sp. TaxID=2045100 RepID=UPI002F3F9556
MKSQDPDQEKTLKVLHWQVLSLPVGLRVAMMKGTADRSAIALPDFLEKGYTLSLVNYKGDVRIKLRPEDKEQAASPGLGLMSVAGRPMSFRTAAAVPFAALTMFIPTGWVDLFLGANPQFRKIEQLLEEETNIVTCRLGRRQLSQLSSALGVLSEKEPPLLPLQNSTLALLEYFLCNRHRSLLGVSPTSDIDNEDDLSLIREVESYISEYYCSDTFTVDSILKKTYTSYHRLNFLFKSIHGMTISEYIRNKRIERSKEMIADNVKSISQIAYEIGYSSISNYILAFKKVYRITPGKYKKQMDSMA